MRPCIRTGCRGTMRETSRSTDRVGDVTISLRCPDCGRKSSEVHPPKRKGVQSHWDERDRPGWGDAIVVDGRLVPQGDVDLARSAVAFFAGLKAWAERPRADRPPVSFGDVPVPRVPGAIWGALVPIPPGRELRPGATINRKGACFFDLSWSVASLSWAGPGEREARAVLTTTTTDATKVKEIWDAATERLVVTGYLCGEERVGSVVAFDQEPACHMPGSDVTITLILRHPMGDVP